jgi:hypothetical protein
MDKALFAVQLTHAAEKDLYFLKPWVDRVIKEIIELEKSPLKGHTLSGSLHGSRALEFSLPGSGEYRAAYVILKEERACLVYLIGSHEGFYERAERRAAAVRKQWKLH